MGLPVNIEGWHIAKGDESAPEEKNTALERKIFIAKLQTVECFVTKLMYTVFKLLKKRQF